MATRIDTRIGQQLRQARLSKGMSQDSLGRALGISFQQVQKYEKGSNRIGASRLWDISRVLDLPIDFFFEGLNATENIGDNSTLISESGMGARTIELARALTSLEDENMTVHFLRLIKAYPRCS